MANETPQDASQLAINLVDQWYFGTNNATMISPADRTILYQRIAAVVQAERDRQAVAVVRVLNKRRSTADVCHCHRCDATLAQARSDGWACDLCGYNGTPLTLACACYDGQCSGGRSAGPGCPHGGIVCPACDDGDGDFSGWDVIRELRSNLIAKEEAANVSP